MDRNKSCCNDYYQPLYRKWPSKQIGPATFCSQDLKTIDKATWLLKTLTNEALTKTLTNEAFANIEGIGENSGHIQTSMKKSPFCQPPKCYNRKILSANEFISLVTEHGQCINLTLSQTSPGFYMLKILCENEKLLVTISPFNKVFSILSENFVIFIKFVICKLF